MATESTMNRSAVRAKLVSELLCYCVFRWCGGDMNCWALVYVDRSIDRAVAFASKLKCELWELREPVYGHAWMASNRARRELDAERRKSNDDNRGEGRRDGTRR